MSLNSSRFPLVLFSFFLCITTFSCKQKTAVAKRQDNGPVIVDVMVASLQKINNSIETNGSVIANENVDLHPEVSGRLTYLNIPEGRYVTKGTVLARVNSADLEAQYQKSKVQLELQQKTEERLNKLLSVNGINQSDFDAALNTVNSTKADMDYTRTLIDKTIIRAPFNGTLGLRQISPGAYVTPATVLVTLQQLGTLKVDFTIPEEYGNLINVGALVDVEVDAAKEIKQSAKIIAIEPQVNSQTRNLLVRALLSGNTSNPGAFVKVYVGSHNADKMVVMVPTNAIIPNDLNNQLVLIKNGKSEFVNITTGVRLANNVEITKGVDAGDTVVVTGVLFVRPGLPVNVRSVKSLTDLDKQQ
ncbi:MAG: efflux RND transporter periplasmic adaptor subunit [Ginsengibacter sp.]